MEPTATLTEAIDVRKLIDELMCDVDRYLDTVALFRTLGCEPTWRTEGASRSKVADRIAPYVKVGTP